MKLDTAIDKFLKRYSPNTARTYRNGLNRFVAWSSTPIEDVADLDPKQVMPFVESLKEEGLSPRSISAYAIAIRRLLHWLKGEDIADISGDALIILQDKMRDWNRLNQVSPLPRLPEETTVLATIEAAHEADADDQRLHLYHLRNRALLETWASTGCRISEAANMKRANLVPEQMAAWIRNGKGRKDRLAIFSEESWQVVMEYLAERDKLGFSVKGQEPVFARHDKIAHGRGEIMPVSTTAMRAALYTLVRGKHFTPHQLRHRAGTALYKKTHDLEIVKAFLGHENVSTTSNIYTHLDATDVIKAVRGG